MFLLVFYGLVCVPFSSAKLDLYYYKNYKGWYFGMEEVPEGPACQKLPSSLWNIPDSLRTDQCLYLFANEDCEVIDDGDVVSVFKVDATNYPNFGQSLQLAPTVKSFYACNELTKDFKAYEFYRFPIVYSKVNNYAPSRNDFKYMYIEGPSCTTLKNSVFFQGNFVVASGICVKIYSDPNCGEEQLNSAKSPLVLIPWVGIVVVDFGIVRSFRPCSVKDVERLPVKPLDKDIPEPDLTDLKQSRTRTYRTSTYAKSNRGSDLGIIFWIIGILILIGFKVFQVVCKGNNSEDAAAAQPNNDYSSVYTAAGHASQKTEV